MAELIAAGKDIDCLCTKCKLVLAHTIIAMIGKVPARVKCNTCHTDRKYRPVKGEKPEKAERVPTKADRTATKADVARKAANSRSGPVVTAHQLEQKWLDVLGAARRQTAEERPFSLADTYRVGMVLLHSRFGDGVVTAAETGRITVMFKDGERTLAHGRPA